LHDDEAWIKYPQHHKWFNKLWLAEQLNYVCGPSGVSVPKENEYFIKPIYNLSGMGVGARKAKLSPTQDLTIPGYFWCEYFEGTHLSIDYEWYYDKPPFWRPIRCHQGIELSPQRFQRWVRWDPKDVEFELPHFFWQLGDVGTINVEMIEGNIIEVHLRPSPDPDYDEMVPVFADDFTILSDPEYSDYTWVESFDDADGELSPPRQGFLVR